MAEEQDGAAAWLKMMQEYPGEKKFRLTETQLKRADEDWETLVTKAKD